MSGFEGAEHAYASGLLIGHLLAKGVTAEPTTDGAGNWLPTFTVDVPCDDEGSTVTLRLHVEWDGAPTPPL